MARVQLINDQRAASALADLLNGDTRRRPVVVVTIPASRDEPWIDVEGIAGEAGDLAEVYLMPTGAFTWAFSHRMAEGTQVYGGAGRVYPVGHDWASDLKKSPLRFAFNGDDGVRATQQLISDTLRMAAAAGLVSSTPTHQLRQVTGTVRATVAGRALVDIGNTLPAAIAEELTVEDVPIERIVTAGQQINGWYDAETNRVDIAKSLRAGPDALATYAVGDVVLAKVAMVRNGKAELVLYPKTVEAEVKVAVLRADVTSNPNDDLRTLMTVGEVIPARVVAPGPHWALVLHDVDDDEPIVNAPSLLVGGPSWLTEEQDEAEASEPHLDALSLPMPRPAPMPGTVAPQSEAPVDDAPVPTEARPTPAMLDRSRPRPALPAAAKTAPTPQSSESTRSLLLKIDGLTAEVSRLTREQDQLRTQLLGAADEREQLRYLLDQAERRANRAENDVKAARARLRKAGNARWAPSVGDGPRFGDAKESFRYLVLTRWAMRTLPSEQAERPLSDYIIGPRFLDSLDRLEGIKEEKVADVVVEIVTGLAPRIAGREVHPLRVGPGGEDPVRRRDDGAVAWRASLQVNTPSARRIHYWVLPDGQIELARVATHDDFDA